jgi:hypothetical protein
VVVVNFGRPKMKPVKKISVHVQKLESIKKRVNLDQIHSQEEMREITKVMRDILKTGDDGPLLSWSDYVYKEVLRTRESVLEPGEDPDKTIATFNSVKLQELCHEINGIPQSTRENPALTWPSIAIGPLRSEETLDTQTSYVNLMGYFFQQYHIRPKMTAYQLCTFIRTIMQLGYRGVNTYWSICFREIEALGWLKQEAQDQRSRLHLSMLRSMIDHDPSKCKPFLGFFPIGLSNAEKNKFLFWAQCG